jgi:hypothetical protein
MTLYNVGLLRESNIRQFYSVPKVEKIVGQKGTDAYYSRVRDAYQSGRLQVKNGVPYEQKYKTIRLSNQKLNVSKDGVSLQKSKEPTFFEATPELINPMYGSFDVKIAPMPAIPVSKPLMQEKVSAMFDRLIQLPQVYSPEKLGDALLETHDYDPDEFKPDKPIQEQLSSNLVGKSLQVAQTENQEIMRGKQLPSTPYAMEPHTEAHIAMINSPEMMELPPDSPILAALVRHIQGELQAQQQRAGAMSGKPGMEGYNAPSGPSTPKIEDVNPGMAGQPAGGQAVNPNIATQ